MDNLPYPAPNVHLPRDGGTMVNISESKPSKVVLFFYPRDNTGGCTKEAKAFTENLSKFQKFDTLIFGISKDSVKSHENFVSKKQLGVPLLSDQNDDVCERYGVWKEKSMYGKSYFGIERSTFIINGEGNVVREWRKVKIPGHVDAVLEAVKGL